MRVRVLFLTPLVGDDVGPWRPWYQVSYPVGQQGLILLFHSAPPVRVDERAIDRGQNGRQRQRGRDGELQAIHKVGDPVNTASDHWVRVVGVTSYGDGVVDWRRGHSPERGPPATSGRPVEAR
jgi:hypothetical protein